MRSALTGNPSVMPTATRTPPTNAAPGLTTGLGWFSLGLGTTQLVAPGRLNRAIGIRNDASSRFWQRFVALQELSAAAGILSRRRPTGWLWARTSADVLHLTMLGRAYRGRRESRARLATAIASVAGTFVADAYTSVRLTSDREATRKDHPMQGNASTTIRASQEQVAARWRAFAQDADGETRLGPIEILGADPAGAIKWRTTDDANASASGITRFSRAPGDRGTEIHIHAEFDVMGGAVGAAVKKVKGDEPLQLIRDDVRRLKQLIETGEIARSDGSPTGSNATLQPKQRPAQPLEHANA
jgi:hypothetical protein